MIPPYSSVSTILRMRAVLIFSLLPLPLRILFGRSFRSSKRRSAPRAEFWIWIQTLYRPSHRTRLAIWRRIWKLLWGFRPISLSSERSCLMAELRWQRMLSRLTVMSLMLSFIAFLLNITRRIIRVCLMLIRLRCAWPARTRSSQVFLIHMGAAESWATIAAWRSTVLTV